MDNTAVVLLPAVQPHENFIQRLGDFLEGVFGEAHSLYNKLSADERAAASWGVGVIACVNHHIDGTPADVKTLITAAFPGLDLDNVHGFIDELLVKVNNIQGEVPLTLEDAIAALQKYLKQYEGSVWGIISGAAATIISTLISPETAIEKFINIATTVYQIIVKPHVAATAATINAASTDVTDPANPVQVEAPAAEEGTEHIDADMQISNEAKAELSGGTEDEAIPPIAGTATAQSFDEASAADQQDKDAGQ